MPRGVPVATVAIGNAENAGLLAAQMLSIKHAGVRRRVMKFRREQTEAVIALPEAGSVPIRAIPLRMSRRPRG
jgi:phosphoribosylcarboxyaminoimidazole (NCAIR) mutase